MRRLQNKITKMSTLQCEVCVRQLSAQTEQEPASLVRAHEAIEMIHPVYIYCKTCKQHLCKPCDYKTHTVLETTDAAEIYTIKQPHSSSSNTQSPQKANLLDGKKQTVYKPSTPQQTDSNGEKRDDLNRAEGDKANTQPRLPESRAPASVNQVTMSSSHERIKFCEECAECLSHAFCTDCEQLLCKACWIKIHNKGARVRHSKEPLQSPDLFPPHTWRKASLLNQQSQGSSSQHDSLSQFKQEHVIDDIGGFEDKDRPVLFGSLEVQLDEKNFAPITSELLNSYQNRDHQPEEDRFKHEQQASKPSRKHIIRYGQSPSYIQQPQASHQVGQMPMSAAPFHPNNHIPVRPPQNTQQHRMQMMPQQQQFSHPGFVPQNQPSHAAYYPIFQDETMAAPFQGFHQFAAGPLQPNHNMMVTQPQQQQQQPFGNQPFQLGMQQMQQQFQGVYLGQPQKNISTTHLSEDDSMSTGIHDEAHHQVPTVFIELKNGEPPHAAYRGTQNNLKKPEIESVAELRQQNSKKLRQPYLSKEVAQQPAAKASTPLRKGQHSTQELAQSPLMSTPNEQHRTGRDKHSKFLTPPIPPNQNGQHHKTTFKLKSGGGNTNAQSAYVSKGKPLKVPRDNAYLNAQASIFSHGGKPPTGYEKKGPHIQWQAKTGKPSSMSSHEMNSDNSGDLQGSTAYQRHSHAHDNSLDAYQIGQHNSQFTALKGNLRKAPGSHLRDYSPQSSQDLVDHRPDSYDYTAVANQNSLQAEEDGTARIKSRKNNIIGRQNFQQYGASNSGSGASYQEKREQKLKVSSGSDKLPNSSGGGRGDSRGSASKTGGSLSTYKSGSGGNGSNQNQRAGLSRNQNSSNANQQRASSNQPQVPIFQPVIKLENNKYSFFRRVFEESKLPAPTLDEENELMRKIQLILFKNAANGDLLILKRNFLDQLLSENSMQEEQALEALERAFTYGFIHKTDRNFANSQRIEFVSLKIQVLSHQCLQWVITSLKRDEMTPTESAIKNRTKEAFDFKTQSDYWEAVMNSIKVPTLRQQDRLQQTELRHQSDPGTMQYVKKKSITPPDKGSSNHTVLVQRATDSSFQTQSSAGSTLAPVTVTTATTVSAHNGITRILKQSVVTEADTGSGSTFKNNNTGQNTVSGGEATGSSDPATDSQQEQVLHGGPSQTSSSQASNQLADLQAPRFKIIQMQQSEEEQQSSCSGVSNNNLGTPVQAIYLKDEQVWTGVDIEDDSTVDRSLYQIMKEFLRDYFCADEQTQTDLMQDQTKRPARGLNSDDYTLQGGDLRMIPGGRYGCTQFLKICGPEAIRKCSVGKTTQMVQLAIKEDVLRHLKTQIVWSTQVDKHKTEQDTLENQQILVQRKAKLEQVKEAIIEILAESSRGMSLAQLPQYLKQKLPFNLEWNELGFPKLKDLLKSMEDHIIVELRDVNHPFAYLVHKKRSNQSLHQAQTNFSKPMFRVQNHSQQIQSSPMEQMVYDSEKLAQIVQAVFTLLRMDPQGITESQLKRKIQQQVNFEFSLEDLGCGSEFEFVKKYIMPKDDSIEFITSLENGERTFLIRSKKIYANFLSHTVKDNQQKQQHQFVSGALSHKNFMPNFNNKTLSNEPSEVSIDQHHRVQTQPNDHALPGFSLQQQFYIPTCESIYGSDTLSDGSSFKNQVKVISSDLSKDYGPLKIPTTMPAQNHFDQMHGATVAAAAQGPAEQYQGLQNKKLQPGSQAISPWTNNQQNQVPQQQYQQHQMWYPSPHQAQQFLAQQAAGSTPSQMGGPLQKDGTHAKGPAQQQFMFDNLQINANIHGSQSIAPQTEHIMPGQTWNAMLIDMHQEEDQHDQANSPGKGGLKQPPQHPSYQMFHPLNFPENDSPRVHLTMQHLLDDSSPQNPNVNFPVQQQNPQNIANNATASDFETQYNPISERYMNESIFSDNFLHQKRQNLQEEKDAGHMSVDCKFNHDSNAVETSSGRADKYFPLLPEKRPADALSCQPVSNPSHRLDLKNSGQVGKQTLNKLSLLVLPQSSINTSSSAEQPGLKNSTALGEQQPRITEETSGSNRSSAQNNKSPGIEEIAASGAYFLDLKSEEEEKKQHSDTEIDRN